MDAGSSRTLDPLQKFSAEGHGISMTLTPTGRDPILFQAENTYGLIELLSKYILEVETGPDAARLGRALHQAYCVERRPMHSHPLHSADAILALAARLNEGRDG